MRPTKSISLKTAAFLTAAFAAQAAQDVWVNSAGALEFEGLSFTLSPGLHTMSWQHAVSKLNAKAPVEPAQGAPKEITKTYSIDLPNNGGEVTGKLSATPQAASGGVRLVYELTPKQDVKLNVLGLTGKTPIERLAGQKWQVDGQGGVFPDKPGKPHLYLGAAKKLTLVFDTVELTFTFADGLGLLLQDDRQWGGNTFTFRIGRNAATDYKAGEPFTVDFTVTASQPLAIREDTPVTLTAGDDWQPLNLHLEIEPGSALDFSEMGWRDAPAGKHGYVRANGPHFEFEKMPGKPQRFYGVNFCFDANIPDNALADRVAERLMRLGYNTARIHHHEGALIRDSGKSTELNAESMAKFDYFMAALINRGLYLTTDLFVSRPVPWKEIGEDKPGNVPMNEFKSLAYVHDGAKQNLREFTRNFLTHVNPHTGRSYAREPALSWIAIINEGNLLNHPRQLQHPAWQAEWKKWITAKQADPAFAGIPDTHPENLWGNDKHMAAFQIFLAEKETAFMREWRTFLRDTLNCRALLTNANGWTHRVSDQLARAKTYDYVDDHFYIDHPRFLEKSWQLPSSCPNTNPIRSGAAGGLGCAYLRLLDRPFTVSEYNYSAPGMYRGVGGILTGALAAQQDWGVLWRFGYSHTIRMGEPLRLGYFDMLSDPLGQAAERASLCIFLRRDVPVHDKTVALVYDEAALRTPGEKAFPSLTPPAWRDAAHKAKVGGRVTGVTAATDAKETVMNYPAAYDNDADPALPAETKKPPVSLDVATGSMTIVSAQTCGGFAERGVHDAGYIGFNVGDTPATVWVSALDERPISYSRRLLVTHLTDVQNTDMRYGNRGRNVLLDWGKLPHLVRTGKADIELKVTQPEACTVYALDTSGKRVAKVDALPRGATLLTFTADVAGGRTDGTGARMLYEIVRE